MSQDYVESFNKSKGSELLHHGVKGMKWGVRTPRSAGASQAAKSPSKVVTKPSGKLTSTPLKAKVAAEKTTSATSSAPKQVAAESSRAKYNRLKKEIAKKGANSLENEDLQFMNARTAAIAQAQKLVADKESWLSKTIKTTIDQAVQTQLKKTANQLMTKHVGTRLTNRLNLPPVPPPTPTPTP